VYERIDPKNDIKRFVVQKRQPDLCHRLKYALQLTDESLQARENAAEADRAEWAQHMARSSASFPQEDTEEANRPKSQSAPAGFQSGANSDDQMEADVGVLFGTSSQLTEWKQQRDRWKVEERVRKRLAEKNLESGSPSPTDRFVGSGSGVEIEEPSLTASIAGVLGGGKSLNKSPSGDSLSALSTESFLGKTADTILQFGGKTAENLMPVGPGRMMDRKSSEGGMELHFTTSEPEGEARISGDYIRAIASSVSLDDFSETNADPTTIEENSTTVVVAHTGDTLTAVVTEILETETEHACPEKPECGPPSDEDLVAAKQRIYESFTKPHGKESFLRVLNKQRSEQTCLAAPETDDTSKPSGFRYLKECVFQLLTLAEQKVDVKTTKMIMILSETFYYEEHIDGDTRKVYLQKFAKEHPVWKKLTYWTEAFKLNVLEEVEKIAMGSSQRWPDLDEKGREDLVLQVHNIVFGTLGSFVLNMNAFGVPNAETRRFLKEMSNLNELSEEQRLMVLMGVPMADDRDADTDQAATSKLTPDTDTAGESDTASGNPRPDPSEGAVKAVETPAPKPTPELDPKVDQALSELIGVDAPKPGTPPRDVKKGTFSSGSMRAASPVSTSETIASPTSENAAVRELSSSEQPPRAATPEQPLFGAHTEEDDFPKMQDTPPPASPLLAQQGGEDDDESKAGGWRNRRNQYTTGFY
jgi:hypothetical protein